MKKTVTINLNSFIFNIDEDAYNMLQEYLEKLTNYFSKTEEGREIIKDIEARVSELFSTKMSDSKQVINISDVEEVISILGYVEDIIEEDESQESESKDQKESQSKETNEKQSRKLYRDSDSKIIGGVCSGLAAYTGLSIAFWRIIFLVFFFIPGNISFITYIILWIAIPEAKTTAQKLEMKGEKVNLENIEKTVREEFEDIKKNIKDIDTKNVSNTFERIGKGLLAALKIVIKVFSPIVGVLFVILGVSLSIALLISFVSSNLDLAISSGTYNFLWLPSILEIVTTNEIAWILSISCLVFLIIPIIGLIYSGLLLVLKLKGNRIFSASLLTIWILSIIVNIFLIISISLGYQSVAFNSEKENISIASSNLQVTLLDNDSSFDKTYRPFEGKKHITINNLNELHLFLSKHFIQIEKDKIKLRPSIEFKTSKEDEKEIEFRYYSRGRSKIDAKENLEYVSYDYIISDSIVELSPFVHINSQKWKAQSLKIIIKIPSGQTIDIHSSLANLIKDEDISGKYTDGELAGKTWILTEDGLALISK